MFLGREISNLVRGHTHFCRGSSLVNPECTSDFAESPSSCWGVASLEVVWYSPFNPADLVPSGSGGAQIWLMHLGLDMRSQTSRAAIYWISDTPSTRKSYFQPIDFGLLYAWQHNRNQKSNRIQESNQNHSICLVCYRTHKEFDLVLCSQYIIQQTEWKIVFVFVSMFVCPSTNTLLIAPGNINK